jgi:hypothetical protein
MRNLVRTVRADGPLSTFIADNQCRETHMELSVARTFIFPRCKSRIHNRRSRAYIPQTVAEYPPLTLTWFRTKKKTSVIASVPVGFVTEDER